MPNNRQIVNTRISPDAKNTLSQLRDIVWASGQYLMDTIPEMMVAGADDDDKEILEYIEDHKCESNAYEDAEYILEEIVSLAQYARQHINKEKLLEEEVT